MGGRVKDKAGDAGTADASEENNSRMDNQAETAARDQSTDQLGAQVRPETQLNEDDGNRTLARPRTDPGPTMQHVKGSFEDGYETDPKPFAGKLPSRDNRQPYHKLNEPATVARRVTTTPPHFMRDPSEAVQDHKMPADHFIAGGASDMYNPEGRNGDGRDPVRERAEGTREIAPKSHTDDPFAPEGRDKAPATAEA